MFLRRMLPFLYLLSLMAFSTGSANANGFARKLVAAAKSQIGVTRIYDPSYVSLTFPMGDIPRERGVCSDVLIRALRDGHDVDLQALVNQDMKRAFSTYPKIWGLKTTDRSIDHRRVFNLQKFFERKGLAIPTSLLSDDYLPGDIVTWMLPGNLPHLGIVSDKKALWSSRPLIIHNIGAGTTEEDRLFDFEIVGHYRLTPTF
jgi:uncharacterized protein